MNKNNPRWLKKTKKRHPRMYLGYSVTKQVEDSQGGRETSYQPAARYQSDGKWKALGLFNTCNEKHPTPSYSVYDQTSTIRILIK